MDYTYKPKSQKAKQNVKPCCDSQRQRSGMELRHDEPAPEQGDDPGMDQSDEREPDQEGQPEQQQRPLCRRCRSFS